MTDLPNFSRTATKASPAIAPTPSIFDDYKISPGLSPETKIALLAWESAVADVQQFVNVLPLKERDSAQNHLDGVATVIRRNLREAVRGVTS